jgi:hypothetical protein
MGFSSALFSVDTISHCLCFVDGFNIVESGVKHHTYNNNNPNHARKPFEVMVSTWQPLDLYLPRY